MCLCPDGTYDSGTSCSTCNMSVCVQYCQEYGVDEKCSQCQDGYILSFTKAACIPVICGCLNYSESGLCLLCLFGTILSNDKSSCNQISLSEEEKNNSIQSKIVIDTNSNNILDNTVFLLKDQQASITLDNNFNENYDTFIYQNTVSLNNNEQIITILVNFNQINSSLTILLPSLNSLISASYWFQTDIVFKKNNKRILQNLTNDNLPDYFVMSYEPPQVFYVGTDEEIEQEKELIIQDNTYHNEIYGLCEDDLIAILILSVFVFFVIITIVIICVLRTKRRIQMKNGSKIYDTRTSKGSNS